MKKLLPFILLAFVGYSVQAQQDPMFTNYMFNSLIYNPGVAGSHDHLTLNALHRTQWWGIDGAPVSNSIIAHTPLRNDRVGVGMSLVTDKIGPTNTVSANLSYAYRIPVGKKARLSIGLQGGLYNWRADWSQIRTSETDPVFADMTPNRVLPNFGTGVYFYTKHFTIGAGCPRIVEYDLRDASQGETPVYARMYRHYFFNIGGAFPLRGDQLVFRPMALIKNVGLDSGFRKDPAFSNVGAPTEFNIDMSLFFHKTLWVGTTYRSAVQAFNGTSSNDSVDFWAAWFLSNGLRVGGGYDYTLTKLQGPAGGSFELMLGYEFDYKTKRVVTPRYF
jgi:type IX secretion system PorP/SprF family membrane protein